MMRVALIGDSHPEVVAHRAIPLALKLAGEATGDGCRAIVVAGCQDAGAWIEAVRKAGSQEQTGQSDHAGHRAAVLKDLLARIAIASSEWLLDEAPTEPGGEERRGDADRDHAGTRLDDRPLSREHQDRPVPQVKRIGDEPDPHGKSGAQRAGDDGALKLRGPPCASRKPPVDERYFSFVRFCAFNWNVIFISLNSVS